MHWKCPERFPRYRGLANSTCITPRTWRSCRYACRDRWLSFSFEVGGGETFLSFLAHAQPAIVLIWKRPMAVNDHWSSHIWLKFSCYRHYINDPTLHAIFGTIIINIYEMLMLIFRYWCWITTLVGWHDLRFETDMLQPFKGKSIGLLRNTQNFPVIVKQQLKKHC